MGPGGLVILGHPCLRDDTGRLLYQWERSTRVGWVVSASCVCVPVRILSPGPHHLRDPRPGPRLTGTLVLDGGIGLKRNILVLT